MDPGSIEAELRAGTIFAEMQPIVDLRTQTTYAYEALVRCRSPKWPDALGIIEAALREGVMGELGRYVRALAVDNCPDFVLFLNVHPSEFDQEYLVRPDDPIFCHPPGVFVEITESVPLTHYSQCHNVLREIRSRGVSLAIDDLGAGYSNLKYIADLSPQVVKLDRALISGMESESRLHKLARSLVRLCDELGAEVIAEGIETIGELNAVYEAGVRYGQGFLLARPAFPPPIPRPLEITAKAPAVPVGRMPPRRVKRAR